MPLTNNELEHQLRLARREPLVLARLDRSTATTGDVLVFDGSGWVPGPVPNDSLADACLDLDGVPIVDMDGEAMCEPDETAVLELNLVTWVQSAPLAVWDILHARGKNPINVQVEDPDGNEMFPTVSFPTVDSVQIRWAFPMAGTAKILFS